MSTEGYRLEQDVLGDFLDECCLVSPGQYIAASRLYGGYTAWAIRSGEEVLSQRDFGRALGQPERGFTKSRSEANGAYRWYGLTLKLSAGANPSGVERRDFA